MYEKDASGRILADTKFEDDDLKARFSDDEIAEINSIKEHLAHEIELAVFELDEAMYVAMVSFAFPF